MTLVCPDSLGATVDAVQASIWTGQLGSLDERTAAAEWIAGRAGAPGSYGGLPAPTEVDRRVGPRVFTGERVTSGAGTGHMLGEEACRALLVLRVDTPAVLAALEAARAFTHSRPRAGFFCCCRCSVALWRHLSVRGDGEAALAAGVAGLRDRRDGQGRWQSYPFAYTVLALLDIPLPQATDELRYAAPALERLARGRGNEPYAVRRRELARRALERCALAGG